MKILDGTQECKIIALRGLLRAALEAANLAGHPHDDGGEGGTFRHISAALRNVGDGEALEYWADTGEWPH